MIVVMGRSKKGGVALRVSDLRVHSRRAAGVAFSPKLCGGSKLIRSAEILLCNLSILRIVCGADRFSRQLKRDRSAAWSERTWLRGR